MHIHITDKFHLLHPFANTCYFRSPSFANILIAVCGFDFHVLMINEVETSIF